MYNFLDRLCNIALARQRDFRGISPDSFDGRGNYSLGLREQLIWPEIDYDSIKLDWQWSPWRVSYSYVVRFAGVVARKTTIADTERVRQTAFVTGDIGELSSAYWTSDAVRTDTGTRITNTLSVTWYPKSRCRIVRRLVSRVAERRVIPPLVDRGLATIESKVRNFAHSGALWPVLEELRGGLR